MQAKQRSWRVSYYYGTVWENRIGRLYLYADFRHFLIRAYGRPVAPSHRKKPRRVYYYSVLKVASHLHAANRLLGALLQPSFFPGDKQCPSWERLQVEFESGGGGGLLHETLANGLWSEGPVNPPKQQWFMSLAGSSQARHFFPGKNDSRLLFGLGHPSLV